MRLAVLGSLGAAAPVFGGEVADTHLVPLLAELAQDRMWRVRDCVISQLPLLTQSIVSFCTGLRVLLLHFFFSSSSKRTLLSTHKCF